MRKFTVKFFLFTILSFFVYSLIIFICVETNINAVKNNIVIFPRGYDNTFSRLADAENQSNIDVLIIGSSHAYRSFDTRIFKEYDLNAFNLGTNSQTPIQTEMLLKRFLKQFNPKFILYEVNPGLFENNGKESTFNILANINSIDLDVFTMIAKTKDLQVFNSFIYFFIKKNIIGEKKIDKPIKFGDDTYILGGGYVERKLTYSSFSGKGLVRKNLNFMSIQKQSFKKSLNYIHEINPETEVLLTRTPLNNKVYESYANNSAINSYFSSMQSFIDYQDILKLDDSLDFFDSHHLNQNGSKKLSMAVINYIKGTKN